ncbi:hypothetical protein DUI87_28669 [Hirundo rustica rustica]|uniref:Peptidase A2 domain-containing protein n=1 Tax=Hirundo rustica rustica TaxID=333673 RepID=A0A3M0J1Z1_HIRRU|nr:hypothetical protein DUI87_28669 [Hirundo rustica rustica]
MASTARQAYYAVPDSSPSPSFTAVQQGLTENFTHFIDQLSQALTNHPGMDEASKQGMFKILAFENANPKTKSILATLPQGAKVADMIKLSLRAEQDKKWPEQRVRSPHWDTNGRANTIKELPPPATRGSQGIDLAAAVDVTLIDSRVQRIPTGVTGPIYDKNSALGQLLLGRSSTGLARLIVLPGVIDADYTGEIQAVAYALHLPMTIKKGTRIAQLVLYTKEAVESDVFQSAPQRGSQGFGSTVEALVNLVQQMKNRPLITLKLSWGTWEHTLSKVMTDTGADVTILDKNAWPRSWPLVQSINTVQGVGGGQQPLQSQHPVTLQLPEGQKVTLRPYVMALPVNTISCNNQNYLLDIKIQKLVNGKVLAHSYLLDGDTLVSPQHLDHNGYRVNGLNSRERKERRRAQIIKSLLRQLVAETTGEQRPPEPGWVVACIFGHQGPLGSLELSQDLHEWQEKECPQCQEVIVIEVSCGVCGARFERETPKLWREGGLCDHCCSGTLGAFYQAAQVVLGIPNPVPDDFGGVADWGFAQTVWAIKREMWQVCKEKGPIAILDPKQNSFPYEKFRWEVLLEE